MTRFLLPLCALLASLSCGGKGSGVPSGIYVEKCQLACKLPGFGPCARRDFEGCVSDCIAATDGLGVECVQCVLEHSGWEGNACCCAGPMCDSQYYNAFDGAHWTNCDRSCDCSGCVAMYRETCTGFRLYRASGASCSRFCGAPPDGAP